MRMLQALRRDERGTSVVELAFIAPILALMTVGMIDLSKGFSMKLQVEQAAQRAVERVMNGRAKVTMNSTTNGTTMAALKAEAAQAAGVPEANVTTDFWRECNGARQANYYDVCPTGQTFARYMSVSINKTYTPFFAKKFTTRTTNDYPLTGAATVRIQ